MENQDISLDELLKKFFEDIDSQEILTLVRERLKEKTDLEVAEYMSSHYNQVKNNDDEYCRAIDAWIAITDGLSEQFQMLMEKAFDLEVVAEKDAPNNEPDLVAESKVVEHENNHSTESNLGDIDSVGESSKPSVSTEEMQAESGENNGVEQQQEPEQEPDVAPATAPRVFMVGKNRLCARRGVTYDVSLAKEAAERLIKQDFDTITLHRPQALSGDKQIEFMEMLRTELIDRGFPPENISPTKDEIVEELKAKHKTHIKEGEYQSRKVNGRDSGRSGETPKVTDTEPSGSNENLDNEDSDEPTIITRTPPDLDAGHLGEHDELIRKIESVLENHPDGLNFETYYTELADKGVIVQVLDRGEKKFGYRYYDGTESKGFAGGDILPEGHKGKGFYSYQGLALKGHLKTSKPFEDYVRAEMSYAFNKCGGNGGARFEDVRQHFKSSPSLLSLSKQGDEIVLNCPRHMGKNNVKVSVYKISDLGFDFNLSQASEKNHNTDLNTVHEDVDAGMGFESDFNAGDKAISDEQSHQVDNQADNYDFGFDEEMLSRMSSFDVESEYDLHERSDLMDFMNGDSGNTETIENNNNDSDLVVSDDQCSPFVASIQSTIDEKKKVEAKKETENSTNKAWVSKSLGSTEAPVKPRTPSPSKRS